MLGNQNGVWEPKISKPPNRPNLMEIRLEKLQFEWKFGN